MNAEQNLIDHLYALQDENVKYKAEVERLQGENEQLKLWKESEIRLWGPLLDYMQKNPFLKPGDSISQKSLEFLKEYTAILERLKQ